MKVSGYKLETGDDSYQVNHPGGRISQDELDKSFSYQDFWKNKVIQSSVPALLASSALFASPNAAAAAAATASSGSSLSGPL